VTQKVENMFSAEKRFRLLLIGFGFLFFNENYQTASLENLHYVLLSSL